MSTVKTKSMTRTLGLFSRQNFFVLSDRSHLDRLEVRLASFFPHCVQVVRSELRRVGTFVFRLVECVSVEGFSSSQQHPAAVRIPRVIQFVFACSGLALAFEWRALLPLESQTSIRIVAGHSHS